MTAWLKQIAWIACVIYATIPSFWLLIHPRAQYWRSRKTSPYRLLLAAWVGFWIVVGSVSWPWREVELYSTPWLWLPAALLIAMGGWLYSRSGAHFSLKQLGGLPELSNRCPDQRLVTMGVRAWVRHPVYLGHLCEMLGWSLGSGLVVCYALTAWAVLTGAVMIRFEDAELESRFGAEYVTYRHATPALIPRFRRLISRNG